MTSKRVIGNQNHLPWHIPEDLKLFKDLTINNTVIMGRKTFESLPNEFKPLPNRNNIVITSKPIKQDGVDIYKDIDQAIEKAKSYNKEIFIIGGSSIYKEFLPKTTHLHISHITQSHQGNIFFPEIDWNEWTVMEEKDYDEFTFKKYKKKIIKLRNVT